MVRLRYRCDRNLYPMDLLLVHISYPTASRDDWLTPRESNLSAASTRVYSTYTDPPETSWIRGMASSERNTSDPCYESSKNPTRTPITRSCLLITLASTLKDIVGTPICPTRPQMSSREHRLGL
jgi:hypothetical protein